MPDRLKAILLMCTAVTLFAALDTSAKYLVMKTGIPTSEIVWLRFLGQVLCMAAVLGPAAMPKLLKTNSLNLQLTRSSLMLATTIFNFIAVKYLRLDQTVSITFLTPLIVAALAVPLLGEHIGWHRAAAIFVGFLGVLIVVRPGVSAVHPAFIAAFLSMLAYSLLIIVTRRLTMLDSSLVTLFWGTVVGSIAAAPFAISQWVWPEGVWPWVLLLALGMLGGGGHYLIIQAYRFAPVSVVTPFLYFELISMITLSYVVFGDQPDRWSFVGALVIVASGLYLIHRERIAHRESLMTLEPVD
ncbi:DMT family transporter [Hyphomicrobium sp.]|uniref:DMT family transporter n=1 Tax=Hyphomicrobium sp. TaxID=82 RepID=UPI000FB918CF|nr:DMT family transporter [Hyphomicrobium sp.]MBN9247967.1 DMT family transporter [Hyphomicrobium sp.]RUP09055.1 MAG: DMT family transporter [Hyphomicrobium sp.]